MPPSSAEPLVAHAASLRRELGAGYQTPDFDPDNGGVDARAVFLLEAPGPKAVVTGYITQDNPDPSARNTTRLLSEAGFDRRDVVLWNVVPWYVGDRTIRPVRPSDIRQALPYLRALLGLLTSLQVVVLIGRKAQAARADIAKMTGVPLVDSFHTSNLVMNRSPTHYGEVLRSFQLARRLGLHRANDPHYAPTPIFAGQPRC